MAGQQQVARGVGLTRLVERLAPLPAQAGQQLRVGGRAVRERLQAVDGGREDGVPLPRVGVLPGHVGVLLGQVCHLPGWHLELAGKVHGQLQPAAGGGELTDGRGSPCGTQGGALRESAQEPQVLVVVERELLLVGERRREVAGDELRELLDAVGQLQFCPAGDVAVEPGAVALGQRVVGDIADEDVPEAILGGLGERRRPALDDEVLDAQSPDELVRGLAPGLGEVRHHHVPEDAADDGRVLGHALLLGRQRVQPSREHRLHGGWDVDGSHVVGQLPVAVREAQGPAIHEHAHHLLGEERVALRQRHDAVAQRCRHAAFQEPIHQALGRGRRERLEEHGEGVRQAAAPARPGLEQLVPGQAEHEQRALRPARQELDEGEAAVVGPVDVLDDDDERVGGRHGREVAAPGLEELLAGVIARLADREHGLQGSLESWHIGGRDGQLGDALPQLLASRGRRVIVVHPCVGLDDVGDGAEGARRVGQAATLAPAVDPRQTVQVLLQLPGEAALAHARRTDDGDQVRPAILHGTADGVLEQRHLVVTADQRAADAERRPTVAAPGLHGDGLPGGHGDGLAAQLQDGQLAVLDDVPGGGVGGGAHDDGTRFRRSLQARRGVDGIAGHEQVALVAGAGEVHEHLAGLDADPQRQGRATAGRGTHRDHGRLHLQGGPDGTFGVILVHAGHAEDGQQGVTRELLEGALVAGHLLREALEDGGHERGHQLRVVALTQAGEPHDVREEQRRHLALASQRARRARRA